jgi:hypothetical protein
MFSSCVAKSVNAELQELQRMRWLGVETEAPAV